MPIFRSNDVFGQFRIDSILSQQGGMSVVYRALIRDGYAKDNYAVLKIGNSEVEDITAQRIYDEAMVDETELLSIINHPGIVRLIPVRLNGKSYKIANHTVDKRSGEKVWYFAMEYLRGGTLDVRKVYSDFPISWRVELIYQIASTLKYLHESIELAHRDLKPENIVFRTSPRKNEIPTPVLIDFGLTQKRQAEQEHAKNNPKKKPIVMTVHYSPPEMIRSLQSGSFSQKGPNDRTKYDIWSLGVIFYQLMTNRHPFGGPGSDGSYTSMYARIMNDPPIPVNNIDSQVVSLIFRMLNKDPGQRPSISDVLRDLEYGIEYVSPRL